MKLFHRHDWHVEYVLEERVPGRGEATRSCAGCRRYEQVIWITEQGRPEWAQGPSFWNPRHLKAVQDG